MLMDMSFFFFCLLTLVNNELWMWAFKYLFKSLISRLLIIYPKVGLLGCVITLVFKFCRNNLLCFMVAAPFCSLTVSAQWFQLRYIFASALCSLLCVAGAGGGGLFFVFFLIVAILIGVKWYLIVVCICIFLVMLRIFSYAYWLIICLL